MPAVFNSEQLFDGDDRSEDAATFLPIESPEMLFSWVRATSKQMLLQMFDGDARNTASTQSYRWWWRFFPDLSYAKDFREWMGIDPKDVVILVLIGLFTCSWYATRRDRKIMERNMKQELEEEDQDSNSGKNQKRDDKGFSYHRLEKAISASSMSMSSMLHNTIHNTLGFSTGTSWERRLQTLAMFSCSLAFVMPGTLFAWAVALHYGLFRPLHIFVFSKDSGSSSKIGNETDPVPPELETAIAAILVWMYLVYIYAIDESPTQGSRRPWLRSGRWWVWKQQPGRGTNRRTGGGWWWNNACDFLPVVLVKTADLPATKTIRSRGDLGQTTTEPQTYVLGYHPHGIIAIGAFCAFATEGARVLDLSKTMMNTNRDALSSLKGMEPKDWKDEDSENDSDCTTDDGEEDKELQTHLPLRPSSLSLLDDGNDSNKDDHAARQPEKITRTSISRIQPNQTQSPKRGFGSVFPGLDRRIVTLPINFTIPFLREYFLAMGAVTSQKETFRKYLDHSNHAAAKNNDAGDPGRALVVVVGGAAESMMAHEGGIELVLNSRRGFVREAIRAGANLVPVLGFGETNLYTLYDDIDDISAGNSDGGDVGAQASHSPSLASTVVSGLQGFVRKTFGVAVPLFRGRSIFFNSLGVMPRRRPVVVVVGKPIPPPEPNQILPEPSETKTTKASIYGTFSPKIDRSKDIPMNDHGKLLIEWHAKYVRALEELYHQHKDASWNSPGNNRKQSMVIVR